MIGLIPNLEAKSLTILLDDSEWDIAIYLNRKYGSTYFQGVLEQFFKDRILNRESIRADRLVNAFKSIDIAKQASVLQSLGISLDEE